MNKFIATILIFSMLLGVASATTTMGRIYYPAGGEEIGHTLVVDFNFADDTDVNYHIKGIVVSVQLGDVNIITDYNTATGFNSTGGCFSDTDTNSTGQVRCQISASTAAIRNDGTYTLTTSGAGSDLATDTNTSASFSIIRGYRISADSDINSYTHEDMQDLTNTGIAETLRNFILFVGFIVVVLVMIFVIGKVILIRKNM